MTSSSSLAMQQYSIKQRTRKFVKGYGFISFARKYKKQFLDTQLDAVKTVSKKVVCITSDFLGNEIVYPEAKSNADKIVKQKPVIYENPRNVEKIIIPP